MRNEVISLAKGLHISHRIGQGVFINILISVAICRVTCTREAKALGFLFHKLFNGLCVHAREREREREMLTRQ